MNINENTSVKEAAQQGMNEMKKSSSDWVHYIETHPIQSLAFGAIILLGIKGLFK